MKQKHPIQPLEKDSEGVTRFKQNTIVRYLIDNGSIDLNDIARINFPQEDREQFAQLIGYSLSGYGDLDYVSQETFEIAFAMQDQSTTETEARIRYLESLVNSLKSWLKAIPPTLSEIIQEELDT